LPVVSDDTLLWFQTVRHYMDAAMMCTRAASLLERISNSLSQSQSAAASAGKTGVVAIAMQQKQDLAALVKLLKSYSVAGDILKTGRMPVRPASLVFRSFRLVPDLVL
jgi:hypothetical protein